MWQNSDGRQICTDTVGHSLRTSALSRGCGHLSQQRGKVESSTPGQSTARPVSRRGCWVGVHPDTVTFSGPQMPV